MRGFSLLLLSLLLANVFCDPQFFFTFYLQFFCKSPNEEFGFKVQFFDRDVTWFNGDDEITEKYTHSGQPGYVTFRMNGTLKGDEWLSDYFDVRMMLDHTCNEKHEETHAEVLVRPLFSIPKDDSYNKYYQYDMALNITDLKGETTFNGELAEN